MYYQETNLNILMPIAGIGQRFKDQGYDIPKPLIKVANKTLLEHSISTLKLDGNYIFVTLNYSNNEYNQDIERIIKSNVNNYTIIKIDQPTQGSAQTCLYAKDIINNDNPLIITNGDQYLNWESLKFLDYINNTNPDGCVSLYDHDDIKLYENSKYAFVKLNDAGYAIEFAEKFAISKNAMNGIHYWKKGSHFIKYVDEMIKDNVRINNELYISPSYNYMIKDGYRINTYKMDKNEYYSLGTPEEINKNTNYINQKNKK